MRNLFDQIGKEIGEEALARSGPTVRQDEIPAEVQYADLRHEPAIAELNALPDDAHERAVAEQILLRFHHALEKKPRRTPEEQELIVTMYTSLAQVREEGRRQGEEQGRKHGEEQGRKRGEEQGRKRGEEQGRKRGLREGQKKGREQGQKQGQKLGRLEALASAVLTVLRARGIRVPAAARRRILAEKHEDRLERWLARASVERSVAAVLGEPS